MDELNHIFQEHINEHKYPSIQWQIIFINLFILVFKSYV